MTKSAKRATARFMSLAIKGSRRLLLFARTCAFMALSVFGHSDFVRFIVLTRSRTGSNLLLSFLNGHPNIIAEGEIFAKLKGKDPLARLKTAFGKQPRHVKAKGFKIFYYHPLDAKADSLWARLEAHEDIKVIHLTRQNVLRTLLSRKIAELKGDWTAMPFDAADTSTKQVALTTQELARGFEQTLAWEESVAVKFRTHPLLQISYEELINCPSESFGKILKFLGVASREPRTNMQRQNPEPLRELILNYDELKSAFAGSRWDRYFTD